MTSVTIVPSAFVLLLPPLAEEGEGPLPPKIDVRGASGE